jgi:pimeloyl-ACP methyl ester carboxylesterase
MATFGLIPGAWHGAWCFDRLSPALERRGHRTIVVDLPCEDVHAGFPEYVAAAVDALSRGGRVVLVGHSLGSHTVERAAPALPVERIVHICGVIPPREGEDRSQQPEMEAPGTFDALRSEDGVMWWSTADGAIAAMYADCSPQDARWAVDRLRRQSTTPHRTIEEPVKMPPVPTTSIVCADDRVVRAEWGRWAARERLGGCDVIELPGGHSPFVSRPEALADALVSSLG